MGDRDVVTQMSNKFLVRKASRSANHITLVKAGIGQLAYGVQTRLVALKRDFKACTDPKVRVMLNDSCLRCEEMILRIAGHPLPGRARVTNERMRTLDIEPIGALTPPAEPMDYGLDYGPNGHPDSRGKTDSTG
jgi:hypothetical protein